MNESNRDRRDRSGPSSGLAPGEVRRRGDEQSGKQVGAVLVVEDVLEVRDVIMRMLQRLGHDVIGAESGKEAVAMIEKAPRVGLALIDLDLPGAVSGLEIAELVHRSAPGAATILISGFGEDPAPSEAAPPGKRRGTVLRKPFTLNVLGDAVNRALQSKTVRLTRAAAPPAGGTPRIATPRKPLAR